MKIAALYSGGKDSTSAIYKAGQLGYVTTCLVSVVPASDESHLLHYDNLEFVRRQAESMRLPLLSANAAKNNTACDAECDTNYDTECEADAINRLLVQAKEKFGIQGVVHGGISSVFQNSIFGTACKRQDLRVIAPLWNTDQVRYMRWLPEAGFEFVITNVASGGLDDYWLGRTIKSKDITLLEKLAKKHKFNISFEGGEAETFVTDCPLFAQRIVIKKGKKTWDGYRGRFEIHEAVLEQ